MKIISQLLTIYSWIIASALVFFLFAIARFFNRRRQEKASPSRKHLQHWWLMVAIIAFILGAGFYALSGGYIVAGIPTADALRIIGGTIVIFVGLSMMNSMLGGRS